MNFIRGKKAWKGVVLSTQRVYTWKGALERCCPFHAKGLYVERSPRKVLSFPRKRSIRGKEPSKGVVLSTQKLYTWKEGLERCCAFHAKALCVERRPRKVLYFPRKGSIRGKKASKSVVLSTHKRYKWILYQKSTNH